MEIQSFLEYQGLVRLKDKKVKSPVNCKNFIFKIIDFIITRIYRK